MIEENWHQRTHKLEVVFRDNLLHGTWKENQILPKMTFLRKKFGASDHTIKKILNKLETEKLVYKEGRYWKAGKPPVENLQTREKRSILIVSNETNTWLYTGWSDFCGKFCLRFDSEAVVAGIELINRSALFKENDLHPSGLREIRQLSKNLGKNCLGILLCSRILKLKNYTSIIPELLKIKTPLVWFNSSTGLTTKSTPDHKGFCLSRYDSISPVKLAFDTLQNLGHRKIAYINTVDEEWSRERLSLLKKLSLENRLTTVQSLPFPLELLKEKEKKLPGIVEFLGKNFESFKRTHLSFVEKLPQNKKNKRMGSIGRAVTEVIDYLLKYPKHPVSISLRPTDVETINVWLAPYLLFYLKMDVTAWIVPNDWQGYSILRVLRALGIQIPRDLSILSFDNHWLGSEQLSSVDLGFEGLGYRSFHRIVGDLPGSDFKGKELVNRPIVMDRGSLSGPQRVSKSFRSLKKLMEGSQLFE